MEYCIVVAPLLAYVVLYVTAVPDLTFITVVKFRTPVDVMELAGVVASDPAELNPAIVKIIGVFLSASVYVIVVVSDADVVAARVTITVPEIK